MTPEEIQQIVREVLAQMSKQAAPQPNPCCCSNQVTEITIRVGGCCEEHPRAIFSCVPPTCLTLGPRNALGQDVMEHVARIAENRKTTPDQVLREAEGKVMGDLIEAQLKQMDPPNQ